MNSPIFDVPIDYAFDNYVRKKFEFPDNFVNKIICGDAVNIMKLIPDGAVDLVITSPPYNLKNSTGNGMKDGRGGKWENAALQKGYSHHNNCIPQFVEIAL